MGTRVVIAKICCAISINTTPRIKGDRDIISILLQMKIIYIIIIINRSISGKFNRMVALIVTIAGINPSTSPAPATACPN